MLTWKKYILLAVGLFAFFLLYYFPAQLAWPLLQKRAGALLALHGMNGSWHHGSADSAMIKGIAIRDFSWNLWLAPWQAPLRARLSGALGEEGSFEGRAGMGWRGMKGRVLLSGVRAGIPLEMVTDRWARHRLEVEGKLEINLPRVELVRGVPRRAEGEMRLHGFKARKPLPVELGDFSAAIQSNSKGARMVLRDEKSPLSADGVLMIAPDDSYNLSGTLTPRDPQNRGMALILRELAKAFAFIRLPDRDGVVALAAAGRFSQGEVAKK